MLTYPLSLSLLLTTSSCFVLFDKQLIGKESKELSTFRIISAVNLSVFQEDRKTTIIDFLKELSPVTKKGHPDPSYQLFLRPSAECPPVQTFSQLEAQLKNSDFHQDFTSVWTENLVECTRRSPETGIFYLFTDSPNIEKLLIFNDLAAQGYLVRIIFMGREELHKERRECLPTASFCKFYIPDKLEESSPLAGKVSNASTTQLTTWDIVLLITVPVLLMSLVACCCVWSFYRKTVREMILQAVLNHHSVKEMHNESQRQSNEDRTLNFPAEEKALPSLTEDDVWQISQEKLEILDNELLGRGAFAKVVKGRLKGRIPLLTVNSTINLVMENLKDGICEVAVKRLPAHGDQQGVVEFLKEIDFMKQLGYHSHIISPVNPIILLEYCHHGDLLSFLRKNRPHVLMSDEDDCPIDAELCLRICDLISFAWQISDGMTYLHSKGWIHRDLACRNILLTKSMTAKVSDFGLCRYADSALYVAKGGRLPVKWMALESLKRFEFSTKSDVWSFGVLLYELFSLGDTPYPTVQPIEMLVYLEGDHRMEQPAICPNEVYALMTSCWNEEASSRPSFDEIGAILRKMINIEDEYYGYLTLENPRSVRFMLNREISQFPATEPKMSTTVAVFDLSDSDDSMPRDEFQRYPSTSDMEDFYSIRSRFSTIRAPTRPDEKTESMGTIQEEFHSEADDLETWSITTVTEDPRSKLEFSEVLTTCQIYPSNHDRPDLTRYDAEMADFYR